MSYYKKPKIILTTHAINRINQRLNLNKLSDVEKYQKIIDLYDCSILDFSKDGIDYYKINIRSDFYFIIDKDKSLVITVTKISDAKKIEILSKQ